MTTTKDILLLLDVSKFIEFLYDPYQRYSVPSDKVGTVFGTIRNGYDYLAHVNAIVSMTYPMDCISIIKTNDNIYLEVFNTQDYNSQPVPVKNPDLIPILLANLYLRMPWDCLGISDRSMNTILDIILLSHAKDGSNQTNEIFRMVMYEGDKTKITIDTIESSPLVNFVTFRNEARKPYTSNMVWVMPNEVGTGIYNLKYGYHNYIDNICRLRPITKTDGYYQLCEEDVVSIDIGKLYEDTLKNHDVIDEIGLLDSTLRGHIFSNIYTGMSRYMNKYNIPGRFSYESSPSISSTDKLNMIDNDVELPAYAKKYSLYLITGVRNIVPIFNYNHSLFINQTVNIGGKDVFDCYNIIMRNMVRRLCKDSYIKGVTLKLNHDDDEIEKIFDRTSYPLYWGFKAVKPSWFNRISTMNRFYSWFNRCDLEGITQSVEVSFYVNTSIYVDVSGYTYSTTYIDYSLINYMSSSISREFRKELDNSDIEHEIKLIPVNDKIRIINIRFNKLKYARKFINRISTSNISLISSDNTVGRVYHGTKPTITISINKGLLKFLNCNINDLYVFDPDSLSIKTPATAMKIAELYMLDQIINPDNTIDRLNLHQ